MSLKAQFGLALLVLLVVIAVISSAINRNVATSVPTTPPVPIVTEVAPIDYGNGIFYFPATGEALRLSLVDFYKGGKSKHCDLQAIDQKWWEGGYTTIGYTYHCHEIAVDAQSVTVP